jgi:hypothetical protein
MAREWYVHADGKQYGPVSSSKLKQWASEGRLARESLVREKDSEQWVAAWEVEGLFSPGARPSSVGDLAPVTEPGMSDLDFLDSQGSGMESEFSKGGAPPRYHSRSYPRTPKGTRVGLRIAGGVGMALIVWVTLWYLGGPAGVQPSQSERRPARLAKETVVQMFSGSGYQNTRPFTVNDGWEIQWDARGDFFQLFLNRADGETPADFLAANQLGSGGGACYQAKGGRYYLQVNAIGNWTISIVQTGE